MGFFGSISGIGGSATQKTHVLPQSSNAAFDQTQGQIVQAIGEYGVANSEYLVSGMDANMPSTFANLGEASETAIYRALSPQHLSNSALRDYTSQLDQSFFETDLTSPQSMADRARMADTFSGI